MRRLEAAALLMAAAMLGACSEGYPGEDRPIVSPFDMNDAERVAELNVVGKDAPGERWRYALKEGCTLEVEQGSGREGRRMAVTLTRSMDAEVVYSPPIPRTPKRKAGPQARFHFSVAISARHPIRSNTPAASPRPVPCSGA